MSARIFRFFRHVTVLTQEELRDLMLRRRAVLSLVLYLGVIALVVLGLVYVEERISPSLGFFRRGSSERNQLLDWAEGHGFGELAKIIMELGAWPSSVVIAQILFLLWFPTLVALVSCDMVAIDLYRGTLRFLMLRTTRAAYFFSKLCAHFFLYVLLYAITLVALVMVSFVRDPEFSFARYLSPMLHDVAVFLPFLLFLVASTQFVSCWSSKPMNAVVRLHLLWVLFLGLLFIVPWASPLWPTISLGLIAPVFGHQWITIGGMLLWTAVFSCLGLVVLLRRSI